MKRLAVCSVCLIVFCIATPGFTKNFLWKSSQLQMEIHGETTVSDGLALRGTLVNVRIPQDDFSLYLFYAGLKWDTAEWLTIEPHIGFTPAWSQEGRDAFIASFWMILTFFGGDLSLFAEADGYFASDQSGYRGYYSADYPLASYSNIGVQCEQLDTLVTCGPHLGITKGPWHVELHYHVGFQDDNRGQMVRLLTWLWF